MPFEPDELARACARLADRVQGEDIVVLIANSTGAYCETTVAELLPGSFSAEDLTNTENRN